MNQVPRKKYAVAEVEAETIPYDHFVDTNDEAEKLKSKLKKEKYTDQKLEITEFNELQLEKYIWIDELLERLDENLREDEAGNPNDEDPIITLDQDEQKELAKIVGNYLYSKLKNKDKLLSSI